MGRQQKNVSSGLVRKFLILLLLLISTVAFNIVWFTFKINDSMTVNPFSTSNMFTASNVPPSDDSVLRLNVSLTRVVQSNVPWENSFNMQPGRPNATVIRHTIFSESDVLSLYGRQIATSIEKADYEAHCGAGRNLIDRIRKQTKKPNGAWKPMEDWHTLMNTKHSFGNVTRDILIAALYNTVSVWHAEIASKTPVRVLTCGLEFENEFGLYLTSSSILFCEVKNGQLHFDKTSNSYDLIILGQIFDAIADPYLTVSQLASSLRNNGLIFASSAGLNFVSATTVQHSYYRFSEIGFALLFARFGFSVEGTESWGNTEYLNRTMSTGANDKVHANIASDIMMHIKRDLVPRSTAIVFGLFRKSSTSAGHKSYDLPHREISEVDPHSLLWKENVQSGKVTTYNMQTMIGEVKPVWTRYKGLTKMQGDYPRLPSVWDFVHWSQKYGFERPHKILKIANDPEFEWLQYSSENVVDYRYGSGGSGDLHEIPASGKFSSISLAIIAQTFEHLYDPYLAASHIFRILKVDGYLFVSVPTGNKPHHAPMHYQHFTAMGLAYLLASVGFKICEVGQWGNRRYHERLLQGKWSNFEQLNFETQNEGIIAQVWILAQKTKDQTNA